MDNFFASNIAFLRKQKGIAQNEMLETIGFKRTTWNGYENGRSKPSFDDLLKIAKYFGIKLTELVEIDLEKSIGVLSNSSNIMSRNDHNQLTKSIDFIPKIVTVDNAGRDNIVYVPVKARAGYLSGYGDPQFISKLNAYSLPNIRHGIYRMFEAEGPSMAPTISEGDNIICRFVESLSDIRSGHVYVLVTTEGIVVKRVLNRVLERGMLVLKSDTVAHRLEYPSYQIPYESVREVWEAKIKLSADFSEPAEIYNKVNALEDDVVILKETLTRLIEAAPEIRSIVNSNLR